MFDSRRGNRGRNGMDGRGRRIRGETPTSSRTFKRRSRQARSVQAGFCAAAVLTAALPIWRTAAAARGSILKSRTKSSRGTPSASQSNLHSPVFQLASCNPCSFNAGYGSRSSSRHMRRATPRGGFGPSLESLVHDGPRCTRSREDVVARFFGRIAVEAASGNAHLLAPLPRGS